MVSLPTLVLILAAHTSLAEPDRDERTLRPILIGGPLENAVLPLSPVRERQPEDRDRGDAAARFTLGRWLHQQQRYDAALREYQRAWRIDPQAFPILLYRVAWSASRYRR